jgi:hydrogenase maturation protein HypF
MLCEMTLRKGRITIRGIVQGVGFRPFVYSAASRHHIAGFVTNHGSEVEVIASGDNFDAFLADLVKGPKMASIDSVTVEDLPADFPVPARFTIQESRDGARTGFVPADIATCDNCLSDILNPESRYYRYWAVSCTDCGPRYSILESVPYDRERTSMQAFPPCLKCTREYEDPESRRHHAQTIACSSCGPALSLLTGAGSPVPAKDPVAETARLLDAGKIVAIRGTGGFHLCCVEEAAPHLKRKLGRLHQSLAVMMKASSLAEYVVALTDAERELLEGPVHPILILDKLDPVSHTGLSELHNLGVMLPYTGLHHLLFASLSSPLLVMTSANEPGTPMITETPVILERMGGVADYILTHNRRIVNRCDDSVVRDGFPVRLSRGLAPLRTKTDLGSSAILGVGPELNANVTLYRDGSAVTSPHIGNIRNPATVAYLEETIAKLTDLTGTVPEIIAHDLHPQFLSTRVARERAEECGAVLRPVQHHCAHIASVTAEETVGIAIDGVGYGSDGTLWGGEILTGSPAEGYQRTGHLEPVLMPGGDLATRFPERMLYGILPDEATSGLLSGRGWDEVSLRVLAQQTEKRFNTPVTTSTGRVLDAAAALLDICREKTYDGEPSMVLEAYAARGTPVPLDIRISDGVLSTSSLLSAARELLLNGASVPDIAASVQSALAKGIAELAVLSAEKAGLGTAALSGGVAVNRMIRETIIRELAENEIVCLTNPRYPFGDGCISYGQVVTAGLLRKEGKL